MTAATIELARGDAAATHRRIGAALRGVLADVTPGHRAPAGANNSEPHQ